MVHTFQLATALTLLSALWLPPAAVALHFQGAPEGSPQSEAPPAVEESRRSNGSITPRAENAILPAGIKKEVPASELPVVLDSTSLPPLQSQEAAGSAELPLQQAFTETSTCGKFSPSSVSDCNREDLGSCGNACCAMEVALPSPPATVYASLLSFLRKGGDSHAYKYVKGKMPNDEHPADDLTQYDIEWKYIVQGRHQTVAMHYNDTLNFAIRVPEGGSGSILRAFSISDLHGSLGDSGQNYKNLAYLLDDLKFPKSKANILYGCGKFAHSAAGRLGSPRWLQLVLALPLVMISAPWL